MKVKMQWIRKPAKRTLALAVSMCILMQTLVTLFVMPSLSTMAESYVGSGMTASLDGNGNLILRGKYDGNLDDIKSIGAYELPIFQDENNTDYSSLTPLISIGAKNKESIGEFENASLDEWTADSGLNIQSTVASSQVFNAGQSVILAPSGGHFLQATGSVAAGEKATVKKQFNAALNLAGCKYISFYFQADAGTATQNNVELTLDSVDGTPKTYSVQYTPSEIWTSVQFDISDFSDRNAISEITISYVGNADWSGNFRIDSVCATADSRQLPETLDPSATLKIADFSDGSLNGFAGTNTADAAYVASAGYVGNNHCLEVSRFGLDAITPCYTKKDFAEGSLLDLGNYNMLSFYVNSHGIGLSPNEKFYIDLILTADDGRVYQKTQQIEAGVWQILSYDISEFDKRDSIASIQIGFFCQGYANPWAGHFFIDDIYAHANIATVFDFEYAMANGWKGADHFKTDSVNYPGITGGTGGLFLRPALSASQGQYAYVSVRDLSTTTIPSTIRKTFSSPLDMSRYSVIAFDANAWVGGSTSNKHNFHLMLESGSEVKEYVLPVTHDTELWRTLIFDISDCKFRDNLTAIKIGWSFEDGPATGWDGLYYIDNIRFGGIGDYQAAESDIQKSKTLFGFENGDVQGWTLGDNSLAGYGFSTGGPSGVWGNAIQASEGEYCIVGVRDGTPIDIPSTLKCDLAVPLDLSKYTQLSFDANASLGGSRTFTYRFHLYLQSGNQIKEYSDTVIHDTLAWNTLTFDISDCEFRNSITTIKLGFSLVEDTATWPEGWWQAYYFDNIRVDGYVAEEAPSEASGNIGEQGNIEFIVPIDLLQSLESKFGIVITDNNDQSRLLSVGQYISDFSSVSVSDDPYPTVSSIKGIGHVLSTDNERLGSNNSGMNIDLSRLNPLAAPGDDTITYIYKGKAYYFDKSAVQYYDDYVRVRSTNGEIMYAIFILPVGSNSILVHPKADKQNDTLSMVNLNSQANVDLYSAIVSFIANRYNGSNPELGRICDYIVGNEIGNDYWNSMGDAPFEEYVKEYERWLRLTNALVKQAWSNARVFASFDYWWAETQTYSQPELIKEIDRLSKAGGDYNWNIAWHPYPGDLMDSETTWNDPNCTDNIKTTPLVSWSNLQLLPQFLKDNHIEFNGETRRIILSEQGFHSKDNSIENQKIQAAAFAYAYYKVLSLPEIDYFCLRDGVDHSPDTEGGLQLGIWTMLEGEDMQPDKEKYIYDVVKYIDTVRSLEVTNFVFDVIPDSFGTTWEELVGISEEEIRAICTLPVVEDGYAGQLFSSGKQTTLSAGDKENWLDNDNTSDLTVVRDESLGADVLSMNVFGAYYKEFKGATYTPAASLDLTDKVIIAKVKANGMSANQQTEYMIRAYSGDKVIEGSYVGLAGNWQTIALDVSDFTGAASIDCIKVWARPANNTVWNNGSFEIAGLYTASADDADIRNVLVTLNPDSVRREGAEVRVTITNNTGKKINGDVTFRGVNGLEFDKTKQTITLEAGQSVTIPLKVTNFDIKIMKAGQLVIDFYGLHYEFTLTELRYPDYTMDGDKMVLGDFENCLPDGWVAAEDVDSAEPVVRGTTYSDFPAHASKGDYLFEILKSGKLGTTRSYVEKLFFEPLDLSGYQTINVDWAGWGGVSVGERYGAELVLNFVDGTSESVTKYVTSTRDWVSLAFDISEFTNRGKLESIKLGYFASGTLIHSGAWSGYFFIDNIYALPTGGSGSSSGSSKPVDINASAYVTVTDTESGVSVSGITVPSDAILQVTEMTEEEYDYQLLEYTVYDIPSVEVSQLLKIEMLRNGMPYPLNGEITIALDRPDGFADKTMVIAHIRGDGSLMYILPEEKDGKLIFKTDSLVSSFGILAAEADGDFAPNPGYDYQYPTYDNISPDTGDKMNHLGYLILIMCISAVAVVITSKCCRANCNR